MALRFPRQDTTGEELQEVIRRVHRVKSKHLESVRVKEEFQGGTVWEGMVEVFELFGHPEAELAYAWTHDTDDGRRRSVAILHISPVDSPVSAIRASMAKEVRGIAKGKEDLKHTPSRNE